MTDSSIAARAQQIADQSSEKMYWAEAVKQAIREKCGDDPVALLELAAGAYQKIAKTIMDTQYDLPTDDPTLFDLREHIMVSTERGPLIIHREDALPPEVESWLKAGKRKHKSQLRRFERMLEKFEAVEMDPARPYMEQLRELRAAEESDEDAA